MSTTELYSAESKIISKNSPEAHLDTEHYNHKPVTCEQNSAFLTSLRSHDSIQTKNPYATRFNTASHRERARYKLVLDMFIVDDNLFKHVTVNSN